MRRDASTSFRLFCTNINLLRLARVRSTQQPRGILTIGVNSEPELQDVARHLCSPKASSTLP